MRGKLERLQQRVERGALKQPEKIGAAAAAILGRHHGHRYFQWELRQGKFHYAAHEVNFAREQLLEGKYVIQTEERDLTPLEAVAAYKELNEVERGFAHRLGRRLMGECVSLARVTTMVDGSQPNKDSTTLPWTSVSRRWMPL